jgi:hypothetical protein
MMNQPDPALQEPREHADFPDRVHDAHERPGLPLKTLALLALGVAAIIYLGPDFARYMRIRSM